MRPPLTSIAVTVSIHATPAGGDLTTQTEVEATDRVSIHATLAGGDGAGCRPCRHQSSFYPRHPRGWRHCGLPQYGRTGRISIHATPAGGDAPSTITAIEGGKFLSTPPPRVATPNSLAWVLARLFLSTPPPRVATATRCSATLSYAFLSTPPPRVATQGNPPDGSTAVISIHATPAGGDTAAM